MAVEAKRGCGYRKVGGTYLVSDGVGRSCDRLPFELTVCPCCSNGIKPALGWTWVDVAKLFNGSHDVANDSFDGLRQCECGMYAPQIPCGLCHAPQTMGRAGLVWIGEKFYKMPADFIKEGVEMGFSRRIKAVPQNFKIGETWVLLAHQNAVSVPYTTPGQIAIDLALAPEAKPKYAPGIFFVWQPTRIEKIFKESDRTSEEVQAAEKRGITPVFVPDNDPDHQGNVHDDYAAEKKAEREAKKNGQ